MIVSAIDVRESAATHVGLVRSSNQDSYYCNPAAGVWVVADGMGGHYGGEMASAAIVERVGNIDRDNAILSTVSRIQQPRSDLYAALHSSSELDRSE